MTGRLSLLSAPYPSLTVRFIAQGITGNAVTLVDTGFDGHLIIPETLIAALPRTRTGSRVQTASGQEVLVPVYSGTVELVDQPGPIAANIMALGDEYLLGLSILNHFRITFDHGQRVIVEP